MAQKTYSLYDNREREGDQYIAVEIGRTYLALVRGTKERVTGFEYYDAEESDPEELLDYIRENSGLLHQNHSETRIYYNLGESVLVPVGHFSTAIASEYIDLAFGDRPGSRINVESVNVVPGMVNVYRGDEHWQPYIGKYFRAVTRRHLYSRLAESVATGTIRIRVYKDEMIVIAAKDGRLQLLRSFAYETPEDIVYHLLNTCRQTNTDPADATISVTGLIDADAPAMQMLAKYFASIVQEVPGDTRFTGEVPDSYPPHYFTGFFNLLP